MPARPHSTDRTSAPGITHPTEEAAIEPSENTETVGAHPRAHARTGRRTTTAFRKPAPPDTSGVDAERLIGRQRRNSADRGATVETVTLQGRATSDERDATSDEREDAKAERTPPRTDEQTRPVHRLLGPGAIVRLVEVAAIPLAVVLVAATDNLSMIVLAIGLTAAANLDLLRGLPHRPTDGRWRVLGQMGLLGLGLAVALPASADVVARAALAAGATMFVVRTFGGLIARASHRRGKGLANTIIIGAGPTGQLVVQSLLDRPEYGLRPVGFLDRVSDGEHLPLPVVGTPEELDTALRRHKAGCAILAFGPTPEPELIDVVRATTAHRVRFYALPRFFELGLETSEGTTDVRGLPLIPLRSGPRTWRAKRLFDIVVASLLLIPALPVLAVAALAIRLSGPGPILFRQERIGLRGESFEIFKLRTLHPNDDGDRTWNVEGDDRVTKAGRILRPTHIDELPQLFNVLRGDMSLVGPRPERPAFVEEFAEQIPHYRHRHRLPVGITGLAQVHGLIGDTSISERARLDNRYIETWTVTRDLSVLIRTVPTLLGQRGGESGSSEQSATQPVPQVPAPRAAER